MTAVSSDLFKPVEFPRPTSLEQCRLGKALRAQRVLAVPQIDFSDCKLAQLYPLDYGFKRGSASALGRQAREKRAAARDA